MSKGKVQIFMTVVPYVTEEEQQLLDQKVKDKIFEESKVPRVLACFDILQVAVADCVQVYGLFKNSPAVFFTRAKWTATMLEWPSDILGSGATTQSSTAHPGVR